MKTIYFFFAWISLNLIACQPKTEEISLDEIAAAIEKRMADFKEVLLTGNLEERMEYYDKEASLSPNGFADIHGKENIKDFLAKGMKMAKFSKLDLKPEYTNGSIEYIYQMGMIDSEIIVNDTMRFDNSSKYFYLWKLQDDGLYRIVAEVTSTKNEDDD